MAMRVRQVSLALTQETIDSLDARAQAEGRSRSNLAERLLASALEQSKVSRGRDLAVPARPDPKP